MFWVLKSTASFRVPINCKTAADDIFPTSFIVHVKKNDAGFIQGSFSKIQGLFMDFPKTILQFSRNKSLGKIQIKC